MRKRLVVAVVAGLLVVGAAAGYAVSATNPLRVGGVPVGQGMTVSDHGVIVAPTRGSFCRSAPADRGTRVGVCADAVYPLRITGHLPIGPRDVLRIRTVDRGTHVVVRLGVPGRRGFATKLVRTARRTTPSGRSWTVRLPAALPRATVLSIEARFVNGDGNWWAGVARR